MAPFFPSVAWVGYSPTVLQWMGELNAKECCVPRENTLLVVGWLVGVGAGVGRMEASEKDD